MTDRSYGIKVYSLERGGVIECKGGKGEINRSGIKVRGRRKNEQEREMLRR